ncbi:MAG TPA: HAD-IC family P-type ATPase [Acidimicrobiales bacterium]
MATCASLAPRALEGLSGEEVAARVALGQQNLTSNRPSRTVGQIVKANVFTRFNAILGVLLGVIVVVGPFQDALFGLVLAANTAIGIVQELRAKRALDRLALLAAPKAVAIRDGVPLDLAVEAVVLDDVLRIRAGDQVVVDGVLLDAEGLELDESLLSGEADPVPKEVGDSVLSGSFAAAGTGWYRATNVGDDAYAARLARSARRFALVRSDLRAGIDRILRGVTLLIVPVAVLLVSTQLLHNADLADALRGSVAGVGSMVPEGLVLLTSMAMAVGVFRLGRRRVLVQELAAIEALARVDVVCLDKTGTLTQGAMAVADVELLAPVDAGAVLGALAAADPSPNSSTRALAVAFPAPKGWKPETVVPFSSARKWSGASFGDRGAWVLGAPELLVEHACPPLAAAIAPVLRDRAAAGQRVLLLAKSPYHHVDDDLPSGLQPAVLVVLSDPVRPAAAATLAYFAEQGVALKVLSGDDPRTVGSIAARLGLQTAGRPVDARSLPPDGDELAQAMEDGTVFGRVAPHQKRAMVAALQSRGHVVAMVGDGVNDVLALKDADIGVALGSGSGASRAVAQLVLVDNDFDALPAVVGEGRRVIANVERVANLFLTKTVYATLLALAVGVARLPFPFLPRHLTVVTALTIGVPAFFLALAPSAARARPGFVRRVLAFAIPAGTIAAAATFVSYAVVRQEGMALPPARTTAAVVLFAVAFWALTVVARPVTWPIEVLLASLAGCFAGVLAIGSLRTFFGFVLPGALGWTTAGIIAGGAILALESGWQLASRWHHPASPTAR